MYPFRVPSSSSTLIFTVAMSASAGLIVRARAFSLVSSSGTQSPPRSEGGRSGSTRRKRGQQAALR